MADLVEEPRHLVRAKSGQSLTGIGNQSVNVAPFPGAVSSVTYPPWRCMQAYTIARPSPVPLSPFVVKNG